MGDDNAYIGLQRDYDVGGFHWELNSYIFTDGVQRKHGAGSAQTMPSRLRITRSGTTLNVYYYVVNTWALLSTHDCGANAANMDVVNIMVQAGTGDNGGSVTVDNLLFADGCPTGSDYAWE